MDYKDKKDRLEKEIACYRLLEELKIEYMAIDHPAAETIADCAEADKALGVKMCKNLFLCNTQKTNFYLLMLPGEKVFKTKDISKQLGVARLSFAPAEYMERYLNILPGAVSVMGLMNDRENHVQLLIDRDILSGEFVGCHPCVNTSSLKISVKDLTENFLPAVGHNYTEVTVE
jgi:Ala-tRNA(Pro) deacylase